jgi:putative membrane protein
MKPILTLAAAALLAGGSLAYGQSSQNSQGGYGTQGADQSGQTTVTPLKQQPAGGAAAASAETKVDTATFVAKVPGANMFEIESSKLALEKASADDVKKFAQQMIDDHTKAGEDFKAALEKVETTSATKPSGSAMDARQQGMMDELKSASGDDFEAKYIKMQTDAHKEAVALFSAYANSGDDPALKEFAKKTLPTLEMHEKHVKELGAAHQG